MNCSMNAWAKDDASASAAGIRVEKVNASKKVNNVNVNDGRDDDDDFNDDGTKLWLAHDDEDDDDGGGCGIGDGAYDRQ